MISLSLQFLLFILLSAFGLVVGWRLLSKSALLRSFITPKLSSKTGISGLSLSLAGMGLAGVLGPRLHAAALKAEVFEGGAGRAYGFFFFLSVFCLILSVLLSQLTATAFILHRFFARLRAAQLSAASSAREPEGKSPRIWPSGRTCMKMLWLQLFFLLMAYVYYLRLIW